MFNTLAHLQYPTHTSLVYTSLETQRIYCVKYNDRLLLWDHWDQDQIALCQEYMIEALPDGVWGFSADSTD
jgi:hypothetical protein